MGGMDRRPQPIGRTIKRARERKRWTQAQLGSVIGVSQKTVDNWEHDKTYPKSAIGALEEVLGISLDGGTPAAPGVLAPGNDWEAWVLSHPDLPDHIRRDIVLRSRASSAVPGGAAERPGRRRKAG